MYSMIKSSPLSLSLSLFLLVKCDTKHPPIITPREGDGNKHGYRKGQGGRNEDGNWDWDSDKDKNRKRYEKKDGNAVIFSKRR